MRPFDTLPPTTASSRAPHRQPALWLLLFLACGFVLNIWGVPLFDLDEGAFSEATRELLDSGVWAATYLDGEPRYDKPILTYWLQAASVTLFGFNEVAFRLHSLLSALGWGAALYAFCRDVGGRPSARAALIIFSSTFLITLIGRAATADALLNLLIALTLFDIYRYAGAPSRGRLYRVWLWLALGMLTKGPVAAAIPLLVSGLWYLSIGQTRRWFAAVLSPVGWLILLAVLCPWLYFVWQEQGSDFFQGFLVEHNLNRFGQTREGHGGHWYYYLVVLPLALLPWSGFLLLPLRHLRALWRRPLERFLLIWFAVVLVLVSLSQTQLPHYALYGVTPLIVLFARYRRLMGRAPWAWLFPLSFCALQLYLALAGGGLAARQKSAYLREMLAPAPDYFDTGYLAAALLMTALVLLLAWLRGPLWKRLALAGLMQSLFIYLLLLPALAGLQQEPVRRAAEVARESGQPFVAHGIHMPSFSVYRQAVTPHRPVKSGDYVFTRADRLPELRRRFGAETVQTLYHAGGIVLAHILAGEAAHAVQP